jgi:multicomponent Na+:H+ antiporter subunit D
MNDTILLGPIFIPLMAAALGVLLARNRTYQHILGLGGSVAAWVCSILILIANLNGEVLTYSLGGWAPPFGIVLVADLLTSVFALMATTVMTGGILYRPPSCRCSCAWAWG